MQCWRKSPLSDLINRRFEGGWNVTWWKCPVSSGMTQMMGRPMQVSSVIFHDWLTMKNNRKPKRAVYHITRLSFSLSASLMSLVSVVMRDTSSPKARDQLFITNLRSQSHVQNTIIVNYLWEWHQRRLFPVSVQPERPLLAQRCVWGSWWRCTWGHIQIQGQHWNIQQWMQCSPQNITNKTNIIRLQSFFF